MMTSDAPPETQAWYGPPVSRSELVVLGLILLAFTLLAVDLLTDAVPLGWDEAVYALRGRAFAGDGPVTLWGDYRAPGLPFALAPVAGQSESVLRSVPAVFGAVGLGVTWVLGRVLFGRVAGLIATGGLALSAVYLSASTQIWPDVPGAVLGLAALATFVLATRDGEVRWWSFAAVPLAMAATLVRFGAPVAMGIGFAIFGLWRIRTLIRFPWRSLALASTLTAVVVAVLIFPVMTGNGRAPLAAILAFRSAKSSPIARGFTDYFTQYRGLFGDAGILVVVLGLGLALGAGRQLLQGRVVVVAGAGLATVITLATVLSHGELRYLVPALPLLWIATGAGLSVATSKLGPLQGGVMLSALALALLSGVLTYSNNTNEWLVRWEGVRTASQQIGDSADVTTCDAITARPPLVAWYSGCMSYPYGHQRVDSVLADEDRDVYLVFVKGIRGQPDQDELETLLGGPSGPEVVVMEPGDVFFYATRVLRARQP